MNMDNLKKTAEEYGFVIHSIHKLKNHIDIGNNTLSVNSIHFVGNDIRMNGGGNIIEFRGNSFIRNSLVSVNGQKNCIVIEADQKEIFGFNIKVNGNENYIYIGSSSAILRSGVLINGNENEIRFEGENSSAFLSIIIEDNENHIHALKGTTIHGREGCSVRMHAAEGKTIHIDEDCMISNDVKIDNSDHHPIFNDQSDRINPAKDVVIGRHCWIGMNALILKGTVIPENCVIGAGSVCNKQFHEPNTIIAGNPAKVCKTGITWQRK